MAPAGARHRDSCHASKYPTAPPAVTSPTRRSRGACCAFHRVYETLGPAYLESVYSNALAIERRLDGLHVEQEVPFEVRYHGHVVGRFRADQVIERRLLLELKAAAVLHDAHRSQLVHCVRAAALTIGLLLNFGPRPRFWRVIGLS